MGEKVGSAEIMEQSVLIQKNYHCRKELSVQKIIFHKKAIRKLQCFMVQKYKCLHHKAQAQARTEPGRVESVGRARVCGGHDAWAPSSQQSMYWEPQGPIKAS